MATDVEEPRSNKGGRGKGGGGKGGGKGGGGKGGGRGGGKGGDAVDVSDAELSFNGKGRSNASGYKAPSGGKGTPRAKPGDTKEMGGMTLVAVDRDGQIKWEPVDGIDSVASREAQRKVEKEEALWRKSMEANAKDDRVKEAKETARKEQQRKAEVSDGSHRA